MSKDTSIRDFGIGVVLVIIGLYNIFKNTTIGVIWIKQLFGFNFARRSSNDSVISRYCYYLF